MEWDSGNMEEIKAQLIIEQNGKTKVRQAGSGWKVPGARHGTVYLGRF